MWVIGNENKHLEGFECDSSKLSASEKISRPATLEVLSKYSRWEHLHG